MPGENHPQTIKLDSPLKGSDIKASLGQATRLVSYMLTGKHESQMTPAPLNTTAGGLPQPQMGNDASNPTSASTPQNAAAPTNATAPSNAANAPAQAPKEPQVKTNDLQVQITQLRKQMEDSQKAQMTELKTLIQQAIAQEDAKENAVKKPTE